MTDINYLDCLTPDEIRYGIEHYKTKAQNWVISEKAKGAITGAMANAIKSLGITGKEVDTCRHLVLGYLVGDPLKPIMPLSSHDLETGEWVGFSHWQSERLPNGQYRQRPTFASEVVTVLYRARHDLEIGGGRIPLASHLARWRMVDAHFDDQYDIGELQKFVQLELTPETEK